MDGAFSGSPAAGDRDGLDIKSSQMPGGSQLEYGDAEILENAYPLLFVDRHASTGVHGYGKFRSGAAFQSSFRAHNTETLVGNMTGTRAWFPTGGGAGGYPGATMRYVMHRADGTTEPIDIHHVGLALAPGDTFEMMTASGGGYGDPLDRDPAAVHRDIVESRIDPDIVRDVYGVILAAVGSGWRKRDLRPGRSRRRSTRTRPPRRSIRASPSAAISRCPNVRAKCSRLRQATGSRAARCSTPILMTAPAVRSRVRISTRPPAARCLSTSSARTTAPASKSCPGAGRALARTFPRKE
jgi:hypothetical protein